MEYIYNISVSSSHEKARRLFIPLYSTVWYIKMQIDVTHTIFEIFKK